MKKLFNLVSIIFFACSNSFSTSTFGQQNKTPSKNELADTRWVVYWDDLVWDRCGKNGKPHWNKFTIINFLKNGKIIDEVTNSEGSWQLIGSKLSGSVTGSISNMEVTLKGNIMIGTGEVGMSPKAIDCFRLVRQSE